jgi:hypothetical protein
MAEDTMATDQDRTTTEATGQGGDAPAQILDYEAARRLLLGQGVSAWEVDKELAWYER